MAPGSMWMAFSKIQKQYDQAVALTMPNGKLILSSFIITKQMPLLLSTQVFYWAKGDIELT